MMLRNKLLGTATAAALIGTLGMAPAAVAAPTPTAAPAAVAPMAAHEAAPVPVDGTLPDGTAFTGSITDLTAEVVDGVVSLTGTLTGMAGDTPISQDFTAPITELATPDSQPGGCQILFLDLGPIFLDVLGLQVDLSQIVLDVTAVPGAGNLLGNLLCAVAGLFDGPGNPLNAITNLLNRLLGGLGLAA